MGTDEPIIVKSVLGAPSLDKREFIQQVFFEWLSYNRCCSRSRRLLKSVNSCILVWVYMRPGVKPGEREGLGWPGLWAMLEASIRERAQYKGEDAFWGDLGVGV